MKSRSRSPKPPHGERPLLDTHAWIWWIEQDARLGAGAIAVLDSLPADRRPFLCDISLWEVATLVERGRLHLDVPLDEWLNAAAHPRSVQLLPVSPRVAAEIARLPEIFHRDPADRIIVATSRAQRVPVLTHDDRIRRSRLVSLWRA
jgi:PIN domain nuclease of toxin-antitoxin system